METLGDILEKAIRDTQPSSPILCQGHLTLHLWADLVKYPNKKIRMISALREVTGISLKDAKEAVESRDGFRIPEVISKAMFVTLSVRNEELGLFTYRDPYIRAYQPIRIFC